MPRIIFKSKVITAGIDFVMMLLWALSYFCVMIGYNNGEYRFYHSVITITSLVIYMSTLHRVADRVFHRIGAKLNRIVNKISKKLKFSKKSFKNLLHLGK